MTSKIKNKGPKICPRSICLKVSASVTKTSPSSTFISLNSIPTARIIGKIAKPEVIQFTRDLPKTRSGKIMRRILRKIANNEFKNLGDTTTLADPSIVEELIKNKNE